MSEQIKCPCGSEYFYRNYKARGVWQTLVKSKPGGGVEQEESFTDNVRYGDEPKTMECVVCKKRIANPDAATKLTP